MSVAAVKRECLSLLGRLEVLGPGTAAAAGRRRWAQVQEQRWAGRQCSSVRGRGGVSSAGALPGWTRSFNFKSNYECFIAELRISTPTKFSARIGNIFPFCKKKILI